MRKVIITDLTRFSTPEKVCVAAIDVITGECFRPMPYLQSDQCSKLNIQPGAILEGNITYVNGSPNPHVEDANYSKLTFVGPSSAQEFKSILDTSLFNDISFGFGVPFGVGQKHIPIGVSANRSIVTVKVSPRNIYLHEDKFKPGKVKCSFTDNAGREFRYLSITDRGFYDYAQKHQNDGSLVQLQDFVRQQKDIYLRVGLGRVFEIGGKNGFWLQVNGIYTFPNFHKEIRSYG